MIVIYGHLGEVLNFPVLSAQKAPLDIGYRHAGGTGASVRGAQELQIEPASLNRLAVQRRGDVEVLQHDASLPAPGSELRRFSSKALLRQPGGFEGLFSRPVLAAPHDLPVANRVDA